MLTLVAYRWIDHPGHRRQSISGSRSEILNFARPTGASLWRPEDCRSGVVLALSETLDPSLP